MTDRNTMCCFCRASENKGHLVKIKSVLVKIKSVLTQFIELQLGEHKAKGSGGLESGFWRSWSKEGQAWGWGDSQLQATRALGWMEKRHQDQTKDSTSPSGIWGERSPGKAFTTPGVCRQAEEQMEMHAGGDALVQLLQVLHPVHHHCSLG